jgi:hypothetical protein
LGTQDESETAVATWLRKTISQLEQERNRRSKSGEITVATKPRHEGNVADLAASEWANLT